MGICGDLSWILDNVYGNIYYMVDGTKRTNKNIWFLVLGGLALIIVGLAIVIGVINANREAELLRKEQELEQERVEIGTEATKQCNTLNELYDDGILSLEITKQYFENSVSDSKSDLYKMYIISCYAVFAYEAGEGLDTAVAILDRLEPMLDEDIIIKRNYYIGMANLYDKVGNEEKANYYKGILDRLDESLEAEGK